MHIVLNRRWSNDEDLWREETRYFPYHRMISLDYAHDLCHQLKLSDEIMWSFPVAVVGYRMLFGNDRQSSATIPNRSLRLRKGRGGEWRSFCCYLTKSLKTESRDLLTQMEMLWLRALYQWHLKCRDTILLCVDPVRVVWKYLRKDPDKGTVLRHLNTKSGPSVRSWPCRDNDCHADRAFWKNVYSVHYPVQTSEPEEAMTVDWVEIDVETWTRAQRFRSYLW